MSNIQRLPEVRKLKLYEVDLTGIDLEWETRGEGVVGYEVQVSTLGKPWVPIQPPHQGLETLWTDEDLIPGQPYYYRVRAFTSTGPGEWSGVVCRDPMDRSKRRLLGCFIWGAIGAIVFLGLITFLLILSVALPGISAA